MDKYQKLFLEEALKRGILMPVVSNDRDWISEVKAFLLNQKTFSITEISVYISKSFEYWLSSSYSDKDFNRYFEVIIDLFGDHPDFQYGMDFIQAGIGYRNSSGERKYLLINLSQESRCLMEKQIEKAEQTQFT